MNFYLTAWFVWCVIWWGPEKQRYGQVRITRMDDTNKRPSMTRKPVWKLWNRYSHYSHYSHHSHIYVKQNSEKLRTTLLIISPCCLLYICISAICHLSPLVNYNSCCCLHICYEILLRTWHKIFNLFSLMCLDFKEHVTRDQTPTQTRIMHTQPNTWPIEIHRNTYEKYVTHTHSQ
jgi:hypothetical protein